MVDKELTACLFFSYRSLQTTNADFIVGKNKRNSKSQELTQGPTVGPWRIQENIGDSYRQLPPLESFPKSTIIGYVESFLASLSVFSLVLADYALLSSFSPLASS